jgi:putative tryptophan/tyrosine transport system substrate-binding protein
MTDAKARVHRRARQRGGVAGGGAGAAGGMPVIGFLSSGTPDVQMGQSLAAFGQGLKEAGYVEGQNVAVEYRWADYQNELLPALAADLVRRRVAVIVATGIDAALVAKPATTTIPIVFETGSDPVALGLVASLNRPGANVTGIANLSVELAPKKLQLLRELLPNVTRFGFLVDPAVPNIQSIIANQAAARTLGLQIVVANARIAISKRSGFPVQRPVAYWPRPHRP